MRTETCDEETTTIVYYHFRKAVEETLGDELSSIFVEGVNHNPKTNVAYFTHVDHPSERNKTYERVSFVAFSKGHRKIIEATPIKPDKIRIHVAMFEKANKHNKTVTVRGDAETTIQNPKEIQKAIKELTKAAKERITYQMLKLA